VSAKSAIAGVREKIRASDRVASARESAKKAGRTAAELGSSVAETTLKTCGFTAWAVGRMIAPVVKRVRKAYSDYQDDLNNNE